MPAVTPPTQSRFAWLHPRAYLGIHGLVGLALSAGCMWIFAALVDAVPEKGAMSRADLAVTAWLQSHGTEWGEAIFVWVSYLGSPVLVALVSLAALWLVFRRAWPELALLTITCVGGALLNLALKDIFQRARPSFASEFVTRSWSFPSGHAMDSLIVYGLFAYGLIGRHPSAKGRILIAMAVIVGAIGYARIYLGVHYLSDVLAGYTAGLTWLAVCVTGYRVARRSIAPEN